MIPLWTRDGHVLDLALQLHAVAELPDDARAAIDAHAAECAACRRRLDRQGTIASAPLPPLRLPDRRAASRSFRRAWAIAAASIALAAGLLVALRGPAPDAPDAWRARGSGTVRLGVFRQSDGASERLDDGASVRAGEELAFWITSTRDGYLMIAGQDRTAVPYRVYPLTGDAAPISASPTGVELETGLRVDATPGDERLTALLCDAPVAWADGVRMLSGELRTDCARVTVRLRKDDG